MNDSLSVNGVDGAGDPLDEFGGGARYRVDRRVRRLLSARPLEQFDRQIGNGDTVRPGERVDLEDLNDLGVLDAGEDLGLEEEALNGARVGRGARQDHLECDRPIQPLVASLVNDTHAPATDLSDELEAGDMRQTARVRDNERCVGRQHQSASFGE